MFWWKGKIYLKVKNQVEKSESNFILRAFAKPGELALLFSWSCSSISIVWWGSGCMIQTQNQPYVSQVEDPTSTPAENWDLRGYTLNIWVN